MLTSLYVLVSFFLICVSHNNNNNNNNNMDAQQISISLNDEWLFGSVNSNNSVSVNLPHTVVDLSFSNWKAASWENTWHYSKQFDHHNPLSLSSAKTRSFLIFDGILTSATV